MKANKFSIFLSFTLLIISSNETHAAALITTPDDPDKIMRLVYAIAALVTLFFLNFYRRRRK